MVAGLKLQSVLLLLKTFNSKTLIRKALSKVVSGGNELVSFEAVGFVGFVVCVIIQFSTLVALLSLTDFSSLHSAACFAPGTHFSCSPWTRGIELPLIQNK